MVYLFNCILYGETTTYQRVKIWIFNTNVKSVLLYACETWKTTNQLTSRLQIFVNNCLRQIMNIKWTNKITNEELWRITQQKPIENQIKRRKWNSIGQTFCKEVWATEKTALDWNPQGYRRRGRPKRTRQRTINRGWNKRNRKIMEWGQGNSWRSQCLEALHGYPMIHKE